MVLKLVNKGYQSLQASKYTSLIYAQLNIQITTLAENSEVTVLTLEKSRDRNAMIYTDGSLVDYRQCTWALKTHTHGKTIM